MVESKRSLIAKALQFASTSPDGADPLEAFVTVTGSFVQQISAPPKPDGTPNVQTVTGKFLHIVIAMDTGDITDIGIDNQVVDLSQFGSISVLG
jgi:hypothetical protein